MCDGIFGHWRRKKNRKIAAANQRAAEQEEAARQEFLANDGEPTDTADRVQESVEDKKKKNTISSLRLPTINTGQTTGSGLNVGG